MGPLLREPHQAAGWRQQHLGLGSALGTLLCVGDAVCADGNVLSPSTKMMLIRLHPAPDQHLGNNLILDWGPMGAAWQQWDMDRWSRTEGDAGTGHQHWKRPELSGGFNAPRACGVPILYPKAIGLMPPAFSSSTRTCKAEMLEKERAGFLYQPGFSAMAYSFLGPPPPGITGTTQAGSGHF